MPHTQTAVQTNPVIELLHVALRAVGVVLPGVVVLGIAELRGGIPDGDFGTFLGAMALSLLAAAIWSAIDARRAPTARVIIRWVATAVVVGASIGLASTLSAPGSPAGPERIGEAVTLSFLYGAPLLLAACFGVATGAERGQT